jgi:hypothetical protein
MGIVHFNQLLYGTSRLDSSRAHAAVKKSAIRPHIASVLSVRPVPRLAASRGCWSCVHIHVCDRGFPSLSPMFQLVSEKC